MSAGMTIADLSNALTLLACACQFALGVVALARVNQSLVAGSLAGLCFCAFSWNFSVLAHNLTGDARWSYLDWSISPFTPALTLHFVVCFVGKGRKLRPVLWLAYAAAGTLTALTSTAFWSDWGRRFAPSAAWELSMVGLILPMDSTVMWLLLRNLREQALPMERLRTELVIAGVVSGFVLGVAEVLLEPVLPVPSTLISAALLTVAAFRFRLLESSPTLLHLLLVAALLVIAGTIGAIAVSLSSAHVALRLMAVLATGAVLALLCVQKFREGLQRRERTDRLALLGRMSSQIAHDIKNPLAAMRGAAQFLKEERAQGRSIDAQMDFLELIIEETDRLGRLVDRYQRLSKLEPQRSPTCLNELVGQVLARQQLRGDEAELRLELALDMPSCAMDSDLVSTALENLFVNAYESLRGGGTVTVRTHVRRNRHRPAAVAVTVADTGVGMNPRELAQAFDEFFTTKTTGSGLGLPLVQRVVDAHGGSLNVVSHTARGTKVTIELPLESGA